MSDYLDPENEELLGDFYVEAEMQVEALESNILVLENNADDGDAIDELFRAAHTLKGGAATVQMTEIAEFTHLVEDSLDAIREGRATVDESTTDTLLIATDVIKEMLAKRKSGGVYDGETSQVTEALKAILEGPPARRSESVPEAENRSIPTERSTSGATASEPEAPIHDEEVVSELSEYEALELQNAAQEGESLYAVRVFFREDNPMNTIGGIHLFSALKSFATVLKTDPEFDALYEDVYHPVVTYYVACTDSPEDHRLKLEISDVTEEVQIAPIGKGIRSSQAVAETARPAATAGPASTPGPAAKSSEAAQEFAKGDYPGTGKPDETEVQGSTESPESEEASPPEKKRQQQTGSVLRVDSRRIDNLLNLVSEAVINKAAFNQISNDFTDTLTLFQEVETGYRELLRELFESLPDYLERIRHGASLKEVKSEINERFSAMPGLFDAFEGEFKSAVGRFRNTAQNLGRITGELQEGVMRIRMVPIAQVFSRFPRLVRDLSRTLKKTIALEIEGEETELDKSVIEDLLDPLIHCVRNSIDHGIEDPASRLEAGKSDHGTITLRAGNEGNMILIEVIDDGKGIDVDAVRKKAIDRGVIHPNKQISEVEAFNLIFDPGFSTAQAITNVSGRGVGLDVVKRQIEKLNGTVTVWSEKGLGTRFSIKIPLTLAIIQGLLVRVGTEMYAIPITSVVDSHRIRPSEIKRIDNYEVFNVRDDVVSLIRLSRLFRIPTEEQPEYHYVVIVGTSERKMGLIVDSLIGEEDVVIKPLRDHYAASPGIAGANITGDGKVSLIIDVSQLLDLGLLREKEERAQRQPGSGSRSGSL